MSRRDFSDLLDKVGGKLTGWSSMNLSKAGRSTLIMSVVMATPIVAMSYCGVTAAVLDSIEKMYRDFLWGDTAEHRRLHLVSWEKICKRKEEGGLGFRCLKPWRTYLLARNLGRALSQPSSIWAQVVRAKSSLNEDRRHV